MVRKYRNFYVYAIILKQRYNCSILNGNNPYEYCTVIFCEYCKKILISSNYKVAICQLENFHIKILNNIYNYYF